jgi:hypothetical protein
MQEIVSLGKSLALELQWSIGIIDSNYDCHSDIVTLTLTLTLLPVELENQHPNRSVSPIICNVYWDTTVSPN